MKKTKRAVKPQNQQIQAGDRKTRLIREIAESQLNSVKAGCDIYPCCHDQPTEI